MNTRIIKIGMDVHSTNYTLCAMEAKWNEPDQLIRNITVEPEIKNILKFIDEIKERVGPESEITCGYEAGGLGYTIQRELKKKGINCIIMAPSTMKRTATDSRKKTDKRDARNIAELLISGGYKSVYVLTEEDEDIRDYLRMRADLVDQRKRTMQEIQAFCLKHGEKYEGKTSWTEKHLEWLRKLELREIARETLDEYISYYEQQEERIREIEKRIEEISEKTVYVEKVHRLKCFLGIKTITALSCIVEIGDYNRFRKARDFSSYLGLVPGQHESGNSEKRMPITKAGNQNLRKILVEASGGICKGRIGYKSKELKRRQKGNDRKIIAYADHGNIRFRRKYYHMMHAGKQRNIAVTAVARELSCFIWGMMTNHFESYSFS